MKLSVNFHIILVFTALFSIVAGGFFLSSQENILSSKKIELISPYFFSGYSDVILDDGSHHRKKTPFTITTEQNFQVVLNLGALGMLDNKTLSFITNDTTIYAEVDDKIIFRHFAVSDKKKYAKSDTLVFIDLPKKIVNNTVILHYENSGGYPVTFEIKNVKIGKRTNLITSLFLSESILDYILLILMIVIFFSTMFITNFSGESTPIEKHFFYISFLSLCLFFYVFCNMPLSYLILGKYVVLLNICGHTSLMFIPMFILAASLFREFSCPLALKFGIVITSLNALVQYTLAFSDLRTFSSMEEYTCLLILMSFGLILLPFFHVKETRNKIGLVTMTSFLFLLAGVVYEAIDIMYEGTLFVSDIFKICIVIFALFQCYDFFNFYKIEAEKKIEMQMYQKLAFIDRLTGIGNRLALSEKRVDYKKEGGGFYIVLFDLNNLKYINDKHGHKYGDYIIEKFADLLNKEFAESYDCDLYRIGGDEFVMVFHSAETTDMENILAQFSQMYQKTKIEGIDEDSFGVSYGFCYCDIGMGDDFGEKMHLADKHMYANKQEFKKGMERLKK